MTRLIFIRHGESEANRLQYFAGQSDPTLTEKGKAQAEKMAKWLSAHYQVAQIYSSDLVRARQSASPLAEMTRLPITPLPAFREIAAGEWQEKTFEVLQKQYAAGYETWLHDIGNAVTPGGESVKELGKRVIDEVFRLADKHQGETIVIVTHATPIRMLMTFFRYGAFDKANKVSWVPNTSATVVTMQDGKAEFERIGYDDYLEEEKSTFPSGIV